MINIDEGQQILRRKGTLCVMILADIQDGTKSIFWIGQISMCPNPGLKVQCHLQGIIKPLLLLKAPLTIA